MRKRVHRKKRFSLNSSFGACIFTVSQRPNLQLPINDKLKNNDFADTKLQRSRHKSLHIDSKAEFNLTLPNKSNNRTIISLMLSYHVSAQIICVCSKQGSGGKQKYKRRRQPSRLILRATSKACKTETTDYTGKIHDTQ